MCSLAENNISNEVHDKIAYLQSAFSQTVYLENKFFDRQMNHTLESRMNNDVNRDFTNINEQTRTAKRIENMFGYDLTGMTLKGNPTIFMMNDLWNNEFDNFYRLMKCENCINDSLIFINNYSKNQFDMDPRNQYHFPTRTKSLFGCGTFLYSLIHEDHGEALKAISFVPRSPKPPIREPNMPEKRDKKDKGKEKKEKKPVIRALDRYVKTSKHFLKINIGESTQYVSNLAMARSPTIYNSNMSIGKRYVSSGTNKLFEDTATSNLTNVSNKTVNIFPKSDIPSDNLILSFDKNYQAADGKVNEKDKNETAEAMEDTVLSNDSEISAWQTLVDKSKPPPEKKIEQELVELQLDKVSIRPEPPIPKLDVEMVKPLNTEIRHEDDFIEMNTDRKSTRPMENTRTLENHKVENRKYHTVSNAKKRFYRKKDKFQVILINRNFSKSRSPSNTDPESAQRSNTQNQQLSITKVQSDQNAFARSSARESENTDEGTSNESKRSSLSTDFQSGNRKHDEETTVNFTQTFDAVDGERVISLNHTNQGDARLPTSVTISSRPKQELNDNRLENDIMNSKDSHEYSYSNMNLATHDEYPYTCFDESCIDENKYVDSKNELDQNDNHGSIEKQMTEILTKENEESKKIEMITNTNDDFVRIPGDPYPYSREHFKKWRLPRKKTFEDTILKTLQNKSDLKKISDNIEPHSSQILGSSSVGNLEDSKNSSIQKEKQPIREMSHDSHIHDKSYHVMLTDNVENENRSKKLKKNRHSIKSNNRKFYVSSFDQQIVPECLRRGVNNQDSMNKIDLGKLMEQVSGNEKLMKDDVSRREYHRWIRSGFRVSESEGAGGRA
ncbi:uncharacterized protein LOC124949426 [Vespa velutina]|uniref:uncharacterized protein LOC124949426 n=1 Tax=Vespa velutina TaxID=202808 RepID=UPI001FB1CC00|nr:uncharacterized protein LOC124949426 [Vespa velutina]